MGEKKLSEYLTIKDLRDQFGLSESFFYKNSKFLEPAVFKFNGRAVKPYRYNPDKLKELLDTPVEPQKKSAKPLQAMKRREAKKRAAAAFDDDDKLFD